MDILQQNLSWLIILLVVLVILMGIVIFIEEKTKSSIKSKANNSKTVSPKDFKELRRQLITSQNEYSKVKKEYDNLNKKYQLLKDDYGKVCLDFKKQEDEISTLKDENKELKRQNQELDYRNSRGTSDTITKDAVVDANPSPIDTKKDDNQKKDATKDSENITEKKKPSTPKVPTANEIMMYASFPRSAGSSVYFSDLTENNVEDSYFELKISKSTGKATFKPLDFLKIRNFDPAMVVIRTEGVKPNVASAVTGIKPGEAHLEEDKEWIVDTPAIIKLS